MAVAVALNEPERHSIKFDDTYTDTLTKGILIGGAPTAAALAGFYTALDAASESRLDAVNITYERCLTGQKAAAVNSIQNLVSVQILLTFRGTTRNYAGKYPQFSVVIPSPAATGLNADGTVNLSDTNIAAVVAFLQTNGAYQTGYDANNGYAPTYAVGSVVVPSECGMITEPREIK